MESIIGAVITGGLALIGIIITNMMSNRTIENKLMTGQAVTDEKIDQLRQEVNKHNSFAERIPKLETKIEGMERRIEKLEEK